MRETATSRYAARWSRPDLMDARIALISGWREHMKSNRKPARRDRRATGATLAQIGRELDVRPDQLRAWKRLQREASGAGATPPGETQEQENRRLRREVATLRQEQAFVKKWRTSRKSRVEVRRVRVRLQRVSPAAGELACGYRRRADGPYSDRACRGRGNARASSRPTRSTIIRLLPTCWRASLT